MATCRALEFGSELGIHCAIVEGDSELVVKALRCKDNGLAPFTYLINDVSLFFGLFSELSYSRVILPYPPQKKGVRYPLVDNLLY